MERLNDILRELGISKVKLAKCLGVSRQMIYNYLELDDINKWPKDKKVILLNSLFENSSKSELGDSNVIFSGLDDKRKELLHNIVDEIKERLEDEKDEEGYNSILYLYHYLQSMEGMRELKYILAYVSKVGGYTKPYEFVYDETEQFVFESILFSAFNLYHAGTSSKTKISETHKRFVAQIEHKLEEKMSRTLEMNALKIQAMKELGITEVNDDNVTEFMYKIDEIQARKSKS